jgi:hypothetical protein
MTGDRSVDLYTSPRVLRSSSRMVPKTRGVAKKPVVMSCSTASFGPPDFRGDLRVTGGFAFLTSSPDSPELSLAFLGRAVRARLRGDAPLETGERSAAGFCKYSRPDAMIVYTRAPDPLVESTIRPALSNAWPIA